MLYLAVALLCLAIVVLCAVAIDSLWPASSRNDRQPVPPPGAPQPTVRWGWCEVCGAEVAGDALHEVVATFDDTDLDDDGTGGGTGMAAEYCAEHCPGHCRAPHRTAA